MLGVWVRAPGLASVKSRRAAHKRLSCVLVFLSGTAACKHSIVPVQASLGDCLCKSPGSSSSRSRWTGTTEQPTGMWSVASHDHVGGGAAAGDAQICRCMCLLHGGAAAPMSVRSEVASAAFVEQGKHVQQA